MKDLIKFSIITKFNSINKGLFISLTTVLSLFFIVYINTLEKNTTDSVDKMNKENTIAATQMYETLELSKDIIQIAPVERDLVGLENPMKDIITNVSIAEIEKETTTIEESTIAQETTQIEETTTEEVIPESTIPQTEPETTTYVEPVISEYNSLDEYIISLIDTYSGYNTRIELTYDNIYLMGQLAQSEAGEEPFEGKIAVCEVVLNRLEDTSKNYTCIRDVIFAKRQFSVVDNGTIYNVPSTDSVLAAVKAMIGERPTNGSMYFQDVRYVSNTWMDKNRPKSLIIGNHQFFY